MTKDSQNPEPETTGHEWDGITELNNPMPRWWLLTFYATILWGIGFTIAYPAWPLLHGATHGLLNYSSRAAVAAEIRKYASANAPIEAKLVAAPLAEIDQDAQLHRYAVNGGKAVFMTFCAQCHGAGAAGVIGKGYPNLLDDDWLWGGSIKAIYTTVKHGIRDAQDPDTRQSQMPAFGEFLKAAEIDDLANYVRALSAQSHDAEKAKAGAALFADNCAACHSASGTGGREFGAPNLTDPIWLYGGDMASLTTTITYAHGGVMPAWNQRLSEAQIRQVAIYVHDLGGGE